jgi:antitoxin (DNA-binding transcriptional repressor) of toxin-antitoxin stability system
MKRGATMTTVAVEQAQTSLPQLIDEVARGEHVVITRNRVPVAELVPPAAAGPKPTFGSAKGLITMSDDFDAPIEDFREYME